MRWEGELSEAINNHITCLKDQHLEQSNTQKQFLSTATGSLPRVYAGSGCTVPGWKKRRLSPNGVQIPKYHLREMPKYTQKNSCPENT